MRRPLAPRHALGQTLILITRDFRRRLAADLAARGVRGISLRHSGTFLHLGRHGPCRAVDLAAAAGVRPQSMMKTVHELEALGLVARRVDPADARAKLIDFTDAGRQVIAEMTRSTDAVWRQYAAILGRPALEEVVAGLNILLADGEIDDA